MYKWKRECSGLTRRVVIFAFLRDTTLLDFCPLLNLGVHLEELPMALRAHNLFASFRKSEFDIFLELYMVAPLLVLARIRRCILVRLRRPFDCELDVCVHLGLQLGDKLVPRAIHGDLLSHVADLSTQFLLSQWRRLPQLDAV